MSSRKPRSLHLLVQAAWLLPLATAGVLLMRPLQAQAHDLPAAELARLNLLVTQALDSGWAGLVLLCLSGMALGALHGLEPGHSKTMMSAFVVAIRGSVGQAALLGSAATLSHTAVVWLLVVPVLIWGGTLNIAQNEPYFQIASAAAVLAIAGWTLLRVWRGRRPVVVAADGMEHNHNDIETIDTGHGLLRLEIFEDGVKPRFRVYGVARSGRLMPFAERVEVSTTRADGSKKLFRFLDAGPYQESLEEIPEPHSFVATLRLPHGDHEHAFPVVFAEPGEVGPEIAGHGDAHERAHAEALRLRLASGAPMTNRQIVLFGLSGGLLPCPAAVTVLLLCLQLKHVALGLLLVASFSLGLAATMIAAGAIAAIGARHLARRWSGFEAVALPATYASCGLIVIIGLYMLVQGIDALA